MSITEINALHLYEQSQKFRKIIGVFVTNFADEHPGFLTVTDRKSGGIGFIEVDVENTCETVLDMFERGYEEKTGNGMPHCLLQKCYVFHDDILIIVWNACGETIPTKMDLDYENNGDIDSMQIIRVLDLKKAMYGNSHLELNKSAFWYTPMILHAFEF